MEYVRKVDFTAIDKSGADERLTQALLDHASGAKTCTIFCIKTPPGGRLPGGFARPCRRPDVLHSPRHDEHRDRGQAI
jgi:hypothetical protein